MRRIAGPDASRPRRCIRWVTQPGCVGAKRHWRSAKVVDPRPPALADGARIQRDETAVRNFAQSDSAFFDAMTGS